MSAQTLPAATHAAATRTSPRSEYIFPSPLFKSDFNKEPFLFGHTLAHHPLFSLPRLKKLALRTRETRPTQLYHDAGHNVEIGRRWNDMREKPPIEEAFEQIQDGGVWITIRRAQLDPEYEALFRGCMSELQAQTGQNFRELMRVEDAIIFITSPNRATAYHIDRECNFLLQVGGSRTIFLFDPEDKEVLPETEIEQFWTTDNNAALYKPELQERATPHRMVPGNGIHIPINHPHWLLNDNNVSVSLSVSITMKDSERANIYRANHMLRRMGLNPVPPFKSPLKDGLKNAVMSASYAPARSAKQAVTRLLSSRMRASE